MSFASCSATRARRYSEAVSRQTTEAFIRCLENAFAHFGGVPRRVVLDNLKAGRQAGRLVRSGAQPEGARVRPALRHDLLADQAVHAAAQGQGRARRRLREEQRPEGPDVRQPRRAEPVPAGLGDGRSPTRASTAPPASRSGRTSPRWRRPALRPLPPARFPCFQEGRRVVNRDGHVEVGRAYYSVPPEYLARRVWVRWDGRLVRLFNDRLEQIAVHVQREPGRFSTQRKHIVAEKISGVERGAAWILGRIRRVGPHCTRWAEACVQARGVEGVRVLQGLLSLTHRHPVDAIERACEIAQSYGAYRLRTVRRLIDRDAPMQIARLLRRRPDHPPAHRLRPLRP